jgi:hypothetical protein
MVASTTINLKDFQDQLVHPVTLNLSLYKEPMKVLSTTFKHRDELSDFSMFVDSQLDQEAK